MLPPPPDLLTIESVVGIILLVTRMRSTVRAVLSLLPPGGFGTTSSTFFCGSHDCAAAIELKAARSAAAKIGFMFFLPLLRLYFCNAADLGVALQVFPKHFRPFRRRQTLRLVTSSEEVIAHLRHVER